MDTIRDEPRTWFVSSQITNIFQEKIFKDIRCFEPLLVQRKGFQFFFFSFLFNLLCFSALCTMESPSDTMSLNRSVICVEDDIPHT